MPNIAIVFGLLLIGQGLYGYYGATPSGTEDSAAETATEPAAEAGDQKKGTSITAMIPAFFGAPLLLCGLISLAGGKARMHAMHVAAMLGVLGALAGLGRGGMVLVKMMGGAEVNGRAMTMTLVMGVICALFTFLCVQSFIAARKAREAKEAEEAAADGAA